MKAALCITAYSQVRSEPKHGAELVSQLCYAEPVRILETGADWCLAETEHAYRGFVRRAHLLPVDSNFGSGFLGIRWKEESHTSGKKIPIGSFRWELPIPDFLKLPDPEIDFPASAESGKILADFALRFLHVPYVWGGKTQWGLDCSGLVQLVMNMAQLSFPRDAWQQAETGRSVPFAGSDFQFEAGDLLFFSHPGKRIHHVAISLGGAEFVHASEWVRVQSLSAEHPDFAPDRLETLSLVKRAEFSALTDMKTAVKNLSSGY